MPLSERETASSWFHQAACIQVSILLHFISSLLPAVCQRIQNQNNQGFVPWVSAVIVTWNILFLIQATSFCPPFKCPTFCTWIITITLTYISPNSEIKLRTRLEHFPQWPDVTGLLLCAELWARN